MVNTVSLIIYDYSSIVIIVRQVWFAEDAEKKGCKSLRLWGVNNQENPGNPGQSVVEHTAHALSICPAAKKKPENLCKSGL
jgi:hypothetical protein